MPEAHVLLRARTDDDLGVLYRLAAELDTWEEHNPSAPCRSSSTWTVRPWPGGRGHPAELGFVRPNLRRIHLQAIASNTGAQRAYEKAGFVVEGRA